MTSGNFNPPKATEPTFLQPAPSLALQLSPEPALQLPIRPNQSKMTTEASHFPNSTHDERLARCHSDRSNRVGDTTPKLTSSLDYDPAASGTDAGMAGDYTFLQASFEPIVWEFLDHSA